MNSEDLKKLKYEIQKCSFKDLSDDFWGGPHLKLWSQMTEKEKVDTITWLETKREGEWEKKK